MLTLGPFIDHGGQHEEEEEGSVLIAEVRVHNSSIIWTMIIIACNGVYSDLE